jgi:hypothetical protein
MENILIYIYIEGIIIKIKKISTKFEHTKYFLYIMDNRVNQNMNILKNIIRKLQEEYSLSKIFKKKL